MYTWREKMNWMLHQEEISRKKHEKKKGKQHRKPRLTYM